MGLDGGGLGSGKSTVLKMFKNKGWLTLDADHMVHQLLKKNKFVLSQIRKKLGPGVFRPNGKINKKNLARIIFSSQHKRKTLEKIIHPMVRKKMKAELQQTKKNRVICDIPLLYERGWEKGFDKVIVVNATKKARIQRLLRKGMAKNQILSRFKAQWPLRKKVKRADFVINNSHTLKKTKNQIQFLWNQILC